MKITQALDAMLSECSIDELLEMIEIFGDCYLESCTGGVDMRLIYHQRLLTKFLTKIQKEIKANQS